MSGGDRLGGVAAVLTLDVRDRLAQELRAHARHGVLPTPSEPEHVAGLPARGIAAPTLEQLDEPREVKPGACGSGEAHGFAGSRDARSSPALGERSFESTRRETRAWAR